ncbi:hypothetical protein B0T20DRAFT_390950 [Sordaria brevicollis]|uniref:Uncharacterized protein n=1 Tax=Sordaria brevicollis TaxID=83679 RepID=A0AAE0PJB6_SORBR|nr:hypothetical protein B0T20DRAFT_390950 [Sordaria brevicollis]
MVETRRMKAARLARGEVNDENEACTPELEPWDYRLKEQDKGKPIRDQIKKLKALLSVCRLFRNQILPEYFNRTQAHVIYSPGWPRDLGVLRYGRSEKVLAAQRIMKRSRLFLENVKHVRLHWLTEAASRTWKRWLEMDENYGMETMCTAIDVELQGPWQQVDTLEWLASLKNLQTLEIAFVDTEHRMSKLPAMYFGKDPFAWQELLKLPKLERLSFLVYSQRSDVWKGEGRPMGRKEILEQALLKDPAAKKGQKPHRFDLSIGAVRDVEALPRLFEISS